MPHKEPAFYTHPGGLTGLRASVALGRRRLVTDPDELARRRVESTRRSIAYAESMRTFREAMALLDWDVSRAVLGLHRHDADGSCVECDGEDPQEWPCPTVEVVARAHGIEVPTW